eukprot:scaffold42609_cov58-Phaeocystis_antarctica.AAC.1
MVDQQRGMGGKQRGSACEGLHGEGLQRHLDAQVATRHHDGVALVEDLVPVVEGLLALDLGDDQRDRMLGAELLADHLGRVVADLAHALGRAHEAGGDIVHVVPQPVGEVDALARTELARVLGDAVHLGDEGPGQW